MMMDSSTVPRVVLIVELDPAGHRLVYVRLLVEAALARGDSVSLATTARVLGDDLFALHLGECRHDIQVHLVHDHPSLKSLQILGAGLGASLVLVPNALQFGKRLLSGGRLPSPPLRLLVMNDPRWQLEGATGLHLLPSAKIFFFWLASKRRGQTLYWLKPPAEDMGALSGQSVCDPVLVESDTQSVCESASSFRHLQRMSSDVFWFGVVGVISDWKNPEMVVTAIAAASNRTGRRLGIAFIGPWRASMTVDTVRTAMNESGVACVIDNRDLTNSEMNAAVASLDCVVLAYSTFAPNSTAGKAAVLGVPVVAAGPPSFRRFAHEITGTPGIPLDVESVTVAIIAATSGVRPAPRRGLGTAAFTEPLLRRCDPE